MHHTENCVFFKMAKTVIKRYVKKMHLITGLTFVQSGTYITTLLHCYLPMMFLEYPFFAIQSELSFHEIAPRI